MTDPSKVIPGPESAVPSLLGETPPWIAGENEIPAFGPPIAGKMPPVLLKYIGGRNYKEFLELGKYGGRQFPCLYMTTDTDPEGHHWFLTFSSLGFIPCPTLDERRRD